MDQLTPVLSAGIRGLTAEQIAMAHKYIGVAQCSLPGFEIDVSTSGTV